MCSLDIFLFHLPFCDATEIFNMANGGHSNTDELNVDNWNDNCEAKSEAKVPGLYAVCR